MKSKILFSGRGFVVCVVQKGLCLTVQNTGTGKGKAFVKGETKDFEDWYNAFTDNSNTYDDLVNLCKGVLAK